MPNCSVPGDPPASISSPITSREARALVAELVGGDEEQVTLQPSTTYGLMQAALRPRRAASSPPRAEFPSITVSLTRAADALGRVDPAVDRARGRVRDAGGRARRPRRRRHGARGEPRRLPHGLPRRSLRAPRRDRRSAARSSMRSRASAWWMPTTRRPTSCARNGYKWLRAGRGTGFAWFGDRALERIAPVLSGFAGRGRRPARRRGAARPRHPPARSPSPTPTPSPPRAWPTGLREVRDAGVSAHRVRARRAHEGRHPLRRPLRHPRGDAPGAGATAPGSSRSRPNPQDVAPLGAALANHGLTVTARSGLIRVAPHVGTGAETLRLFGDALAAFAQSRVW